VKPAAPPLPPLRRRAPMTDAETVRVLFEKLWRPGATQPGSQRSPVSQGSRLSSDTRSAGLNYPRPAPPLRPSRLTTRPGPPGHCGHGLDLGRALPHRVGAWPPLPRFAFRKLRGDVVRLLSGSSASPYWGNGTVDPAGRRPKLQLLDPGTPGDQGGGT
jgi:hypothetical protein